MTYDQALAEQERRALEGVRQCTDAELREAARLTRDQKALHRILQVFRERREAKHRREAWKVSA